MSFISSRRTAEIPDLTNLSLYATPYLVTSDNRTTAQVVRPLTPEDPQFNRIPSPQDYMYNGNLQQNPG